MPATRRVVADHSAASRTRRKSPGGKRRKSKGVVALICLCGKPDKSRSLVRLGKQDFRRLSATPQNRDTNSFECTRRSFRGVPQIVGLRGEVDQVNQEPRTYAHDSAPENTGRGIGRNRNRRFDAHLFVFTAQMRAGHIGGVSVIEQIAVAHGEVEVAAGGVSGLGRELLVRDVVGLGQRSRFLAVQEDRPAVREDCGELQLLCLKRRSFFDR